MVSKGFIVTQNLNQIPTPMKEYLCKMCSEGRIKFDYVLD